MYSKSIAALYALVLAGAAAAQSTMTVATPPSVVQCQPVQLSWSGGTAPYFPSIIPGQQAGSPALKEFPSQTGTSLTWTVDLIASTYITIQIRDSTGQLQYSSAVSIQNSADASCVNANISASASGGSTPTGGATSAAPTATSPAGTTSSGTVRTATTVTGTTSAPTSTSTNNTNSASMVTKGAFGVAGLAGLIGAALF
ncbi:unnamed protein product [Rhizoctonia solani]|uniref:Uncharacterized protein n=1 Tax=Rhizoctonia solani TaxID=456999 RepID=A0A8H3GXG8_9AGAM|nr:uncharacterized protein RhiXN_02998 [Rhizoctonia solani]KAF8674119.1 hypothetical protein RHS04_07514 [Rhizoctonia solani]KAF8753255.1 hypothetical protein RHS01_07126 [Rhizoctonia solani]QRW18074.1 hypothetical protein RhiXN_02998 [Rhizoctonia solani]CAE6473238.1 unnamed protein product [Rhizoctonia solani]